MPKRNVLRRRKDFDAVYKGGRSQGSRYVVVFYRKNGLRENRISFLASKKVGNSVKRNRARRLMKEAFRLLRPDLPKGYDLVIIARAGITAAREQEVEESLGKTLRKIGGMMNGTRKQDIK